MRVGCRSLPQLRQQRTRESLHREDVDVVHPLPVRRLAVLDTVGATSSAGDVRKGVHGAGAGEELRQSVDVGIRREIRRERDGTSLRLQRRQAISPARDSDDLPSARAQPAHRRRADSRTCPRHHSASGHTSTLAAAGPPECYVTFPHCC